MIGFWFVVDGRAYFPYISPPLLEGQTADDAVNYLLEMIREGEKRIIWDHTGEPWMVVLAMVEAHPAVAKRLYTAGGRGMLHVILMNRKGQYLCYGHLPQDGFIPGKPLADYRGKTGIPRRLTITPETELWVEVMEELLARLEAEGIVEAG